MPLTDRFRRHASTILIGVVAAAAIMATQRDYGLALDEATYIWAADEVRDWFVELPTNGLGESLSRSGIERRWHFLEPPTMRNPSGHSNFNLPAACHVINLGWIVSHHFLEELSAYRFGSVLLFGVCSAALFATLRETHGVWTGWWSLLCLWSTPRIVGHAHLAATETTLCCFWTLCLLALCRLAPAATPVAKRERLHNLAQEQHDDFAAGTRRKCVLVSTVVFGALAGLTAATKLTGWLAAVPILIWLAVCRPKGWLYVIGAAVVLVPALIVVLTPNLWHHPVTRLAQYVRDASTNPWKITSIYLGTAYRDGQPWSSGVVLVLATTPVALLLLTLIGFFFGFRDRLMWLFAANAGWLILLRCLGKLPQHDGERQFLPAFYFLAILAGMGLGAVGRRIGTSISIERLSHSTRRPLAAIALVLGLGVLVEPILDSWTYRKHGLSYYNRLVGGLPGASRLGFEVSYWFEAATDDVWREMLDQVPQGGRVFIHPDHPGLEILKRRGIWRPDLRSVGPFDSDYVIFYAKKAAYVREFEATKALDVTDWGGAFENAGAIVERRFMGERLVALLPAAAIEKQ